MTQPSFRLNHGMPILRLRSVRFIFPLLIYAAAPPFVAGWRRSREPVKEPAPRECEIGDTCQLYPEPECGVYMAPSTIGVANLGIYTAKDLSEGTVVNFPEIVVPLLFREWGEQDSRDGTLWDRYIWEGPVVGIESKTDLIKDDSGAAFIPGVGCTVNSRLDLHNILSTRGSKYDTAGLHRRKDPGVTAFTPYHSSETTIRLPVKAGDELFAAYGDNWIPWIPGALITFDETMDDADVFLRDFYEWVKSNDLPFHVVDGLWNLASRDFPHDSKVLGVLPQHNWTIVSSEMERHDEEFSVVRHFIHQIGHRDVEWLEKNGKCQDHIRPGRSTIEQAGRGAFANRFLPKGTVVGYSPLVHNGKARHILNITYEESDRIYHNEDLIINYSFGHRDSTIVLTPYGAMVNYINHDRARANVRVRWPLEELVAHKPEWLKKDVDFFSHTEEKIGLSFDYIAIRDIEEGEEIFMDYGDEWQEAWDDYSQHWKPPPGADRYIHATEWTGPLLTEQEQKIRPYPSNLHTLCVSNYIIDGDGYKFTPPIKSTDHRVHCQVVNRYDVDPSDVSYDVRMLVDDKQIFVRGVAGDGIELVDKARTADWHTEGAFRHEIMIPDDIFPAIFSRAVGLMTSVYWDDALSKLYI